MDSEEEANNYIDWHNETDKAYIKKTDLEIEFRSGEYTRCGNYCSVADFCKQKKEKTMKEQKPKPKRVVRKVKKSGVVG